MGSHRASFANPVRAKRICLRLYAFKRFPRLGYNKTIAAVFDGLAFALFVSIASAFSISPAQAQTTSANKANIAVKLPVVGAGVSERAQRYLNVSTLLAEIEASLRKTRKFEVLTRRESALESIRKEQKFSGSQLTASDGAAEGLLKNADYLLIPTIQDFKFYRSVSPVPNIQNKYFRQDSGLLELNAQVYDTNTGAIKADYYLKSTFGTKRQVVNSNGGAPSSVHFTRMAKDVSVQVSDQLVDTVFLMRVLNQQGDRVWINRGQDGGLKEGDLLNVYRPGDKLIDPDTGENLGTAEMLIGEIKVVRVNPKFTVAVLQSGSDGGQVKEGDIVRKP